MNLYNLEVIGRKNKVDIHIAGGKIKSIRDSENNFPQSTDNRIHFEDAIAFAGLINSHDHLDFNLFPQMGNRIYRNYDEWGRDIHSVNKENIRSVLKIPQALRTEWGLYKNLLNGITTVVNHGQKLQISNDLITVIQNNYSLHSVKFEEWWRLKLNSFISRKQSYVIHIGEGTDASSKAEIDDLIKWNLFKRKIIGVHGVAMNEEQAKAFYAIVWCPSSNRFMLNATSAIDELKAKTQILFGTDSTLTASWNLWDQLRYARDTLLLTDHELYNALTKTAAEIWNLGESGAINDGYVADLCIAKTNGKRGFDALYDVNPGDMLLIMHKGEVRLFDKALRKQKIECGIQAGKFSTIYLDDKIKFVFGNVPALLNDIRSYYPQAHFPIST